MIDEGYSSGEMRMVPWVVCLFARVPSIPLLLYAKC